MKEIINLIILQLSPAAAMMPAAGLMSPAGLQSPYLGLAAAQPLAAAQLQAQLQAQLPVSSASHEVASQSGAIAFQSMQKNP